MTAFTPTPPRDAAASASDPVTEHCEAFAVQEQYRRQYEATGNEADYLKYHEAYRKANQCLYRVMALRAREAGQR